MARRKAKNHLEPTQRIPFKPIVWVGGCLVFLSVISACPGVRGQERGALGKMPQGGMRLSGTVRRAARYSMLNDQREDVRAVMQAEACRGWHFRDRPLLRLPRARRSRIFLNRPGVRRVLGVINPHPCRVHTPGQKVLGAPGVDLSLDRVDREMAAAARRAVVLSAAALAVCGVLAMFTFHPANRRPPPLVKAARTIGREGYDVPALVHSIKNMLSGIKGGTYLVKAGRENDDPAMITSGVEMLDRNIRRVESLVRDMLAISRPRQPRLKPVDAAWLASEAIACMRPAALEKGVALELEAPAPAGVALRVDDRAILDCLQNLISNALDAASEAKGGKVSLGLRADRREAVFRVRDNGPGLDAEGRERIFQGFYSTKGAEGAGLGLMVTDKHAREHGGRVEYRNLPGGGAEFRLALPRRREAAPEGPAENP